MTTDTFILITYGGFDASARLELGFGMVFQEDEKSEGRRLASGVLAPLGLSVPDIPIGFRRRLTQAHSRPSSTCFFDFSDDF